MIQGTRASNGVFVGPVMKLDSHEEVSKLSPGVVMVVSDTDPDWMPAFEFLAEHGGAIITEIGGRLCHAAVVSRELKIPCVVGVQNAKNVLANGQKVSVDGSKGTVEIL